MLTKKKTLGLTGKWIFNHYFESISQDNLNYLNYQFVNCHRNLVLKTIVKETETQLTLITNLNEQN